MRTEWWYAFVLPVNWKLAEEAFLEQYHVIETHPELVIPRRFAPKDPAAFDPRDLHRRRAALSARHERGHGGMVHANDVAVAERQRNMALPTTRRGHGHLARAASTTPWWPGTANAAAIIPDLNELEARGINETMCYCFPHYFVLPMYSSASSYRFRPLGPEETLMEIWSLTRYPEGQEPGPPTPPEPCAYDDQRMPPIPTQDFSNLPRQQQGLHNKGFEYMRLSEGRGGHRQLRAHPRRLPGRTPLRELRPLSCRQREPLERPVVDLGF